MPKRPTPAQPSRYSTVDVCQRIESMREKLGLMQKDVAAAIGALESQYSKKIRNHLSSFTVDEIGAVAELFQAPPGWPFIDEESARLLLAVQEYLARRH